MIYQDRIYGKVKIDEPIILELIESSSLQRLKGIFQMGHRAWYPQSSHTRLEHSIGVFILLKKFNASIEEQIAGLIHDVSHTVFCHMGDYIFDSGSQKFHTFQDDIHKKFVFDTEIPKILRKYGFDIDFILNEKNFPLKEKPLPNLCADRIDYFLRDAFQFKEFSKKEIKKFLVNFQIIENSWVFKDLRVAKKFAKKFKKMNDLHWSGINAALMFGTVADVIKYGLTKRYLKEKDVFTTDKIVLKKLNEFRKKDKKLNLLFERMQKKIGWKLNKKDYDIHVFTKSRAIDPLVKMNAGIKYLSEIDKNWIKIIKEDSKPKEYFIKFNEKF